MLIYRVITKQQAKREQTHPVCLHAVEKYKKLESINTQNKYKTMKKKKKRPDKKKTNFFRVFCKCLNSKKTIQDHSEELLGNNNNKKRFYWKNHWSQLS